MALNLRDYQNALNVQSACNLSGVIFSFRDTMTRLCEDVQSGTDARNHHPICRLYAEQIMHLTGGGMGTSGYAEAYQSVVDKIADLQSAEMEQRLAELSEAS